MNLSHCWSNPVIAIVLVVALSACGRNDFSFKEEVRLASGEIIQVERFVTAAPLGEIGGPGGWEPKYMSLEIASPKRPGDPPKWESTTGLLPIVFDKDPASGEWTLIATFYTCEPWYALGRPKLPYAEFRVRSDQWRRVELSPQWIGRPANVFTGVHSRGEPKLVTLTYKQAEESDLRIAPKYRVIVDKWHTGC